MTEIEILLRRIGWSLNETIRRLGVSEAAMRRWCNGSRTPSPAVVAWLERVAAAVEGAGDPPAAPARTHAEK